MIVSITISVDSNQSSRWPRSRTSWAQAIATPSARKPVQSNFEICFSVWSESANQTIAMAIRPGGTTIRKAPRQL
jgi:hypothetical protein